MKTFDLIRYKTETNTPGILIVEDMQFKLEGLPWLNNECGISCVEDGLYKFYRDPSPNKDNREVIELEPKNGRSQVQFHVGKLPQLKGCFGHESRLMEDICFKALPEVGQIRITTINGPLIQE